MRITGLSIDGFGVFSDVALNDLPPGLILFVGNNEAGKSTTLAFVHTVLFGYPDGRSKEKAYPPLRGGTPGGRLMLDTDAYGPVTLERKGGAKGGLITVSYPGGQTGGPAALDKLLGGTNRKLYRNLYAFGLTELHTIDTLTNEDVRDVIYGASLGTGFRTLPEARKRLKKGMAVLFKAGGSKPTMNQLLKKLEETRGRLKEAQKGVDEYEAEGADIAVLAASIEQARNELSIARERRAHVEALLRLWDDWVGLQDAETRLDTLTERVDDFPDRGLARMETLSQAIAQQREELQSTEDDLAAQRKSLEALEFDEGLLKQSAEIAGLLQGLETYNKAVQAIPADRDRAKQREADMVAVLTELGAGWTEERGLALDRSAHAREEISGHKRAIEKADRESTALVAAAGTSGAALKEAEEEEERTRDRVTKLEGSALEVDRRILEKLRGGRDQFSSVLTDLPRREAEHGEAIEALNRTLREIDRDWTADRLDELDVSLPAQQKIEQFEAALEAANATVRDATTGSRNASDAAEKSKRTTKEKRTAWEAAEGEVQDASNLQARRNQVRELQRALSKHGTVEATLELERQAQAMAGADAGVTSLGGPDIRRLLLFTALGIGGLGVLFAVVLFFVDQGTAAGVAAVLAVVTAAGLLFLRNALPQSGSSSGHTGPVPGSDSERMKELSDQLAAIVGEIDGLKRVLDIAGAVDLADVDRMTDETAKLIEQAAERSRLAKSVDEWSGQLERDEGDLATAENALEESNKVLSRTQGEWENHLRSLHLPAGTTPRTVGLVFAKVEKALAEQRRISDLAARIDLMTAARTEYVSFMAEVPPLREVVDKKDDAVVAALATFLAETDQQEHRLRELENARTMLGDCAVRTSTAADKLERANAELTKARKSQDGTHAAWDLWLQDHGVDAGWSPETAEHALGRVIRLAEIAADRNSVKSDAARHQAEVDEYRQRVATVFGVLGRPVPTADLLPVEIRRVADERAEHDTHRTGHTQLAATISETEGRLKIRRDRIEQAATKLAELVGAGGAKDEEEFRRRGEAHQNLQRLTADIAACESSIQKLSGTPDLDALKAELANESRDRLGAEKAELADRIDETVAKHDEELERRGAAEKHQEALYSDDSVAQLRAQEEGILENLATCARDWARHALADSLLTAAKERHAQANQPKVIQEAGKYFKTITDGRYAQVFAPPGENTMTVIDAGGRSKDADDLSRGSMEQLYLAIRFGYISAQSAGPEPLPILMDDVLVNFDPARAAAAAAGILQMAKTRQVLFFTCHPRVVEIFQNQASGLPVYRIIDNDIVPIPG